MTRSRHGYPQGNKYKQRSTGALHQIRKEISINAIKTSAQRENMARPNGTEEKNRAAYKNAELVIELFITGKTLKTSLADAGMNPTSFINQLKTYSELYSRYSLAKEAIADLIASETVEISDNQKEDPNSRRIRIEARRWLASKYHRKQYGENISIEHTGEISLKAAITEGKQRAIAAYKTIEHEAEPIQCVSEVQPENVSD